MADGLDAAAPTDRMADKPNVTPGQRSYLDGLLDAGVHPANDLRALSIGAYVCQARAAGQSDQAVWDAVAPMVRSDVAAAGTPASSPPSAAFMELDATIGHYIGIAQQRLC